jgi:outer membrane protein assembly factor BamB
MVANDMILVGTRNGLFFGLAPDTGQVLWRYRLFSQRDLVTNYDDDRGGNNNDNGGAGGEGATPVFKNK